MEAVAVAIGEKLLSTFLTVLIDRLTSGELPSLMRREGLHSLLKKWEKELRRINGALEDAEEKRLTGDAGVKLWLEDLQNLAYDIEDLLNDFTAQVQQKKEKAESKRASKTLLVVPSCFSPREFMHDQKMRSEIEAIDCRLQEIIKQKHSLSLRENDANQLASKRAQQQRRTTHLPGSCFVGREKEKMEVLRLLIGEEGGINKINVTLKMIPIIGMGGVGKTALVQQIYHDDRVASYFDVKAWTCVSYDFDVAAITKTILENITGFPGEGNDLGQLQEKLWANLSGKKFLIILDDVWIEKYGEWTDFVKPFQAGAEGSVIVVTSRNLRVASMAGAPAYCLKELPEDACLTLLAHHALGAKNFDDHRHLKSLGEKIVIKCKGLPLAVKTLGGLLRANVDPHEWEAISNSRIWDLPEERNDILPSLKLSYLHLPSHLKRCFAYCAIFPKDYEIERDELIHWWMAEGLVDGSKGKNIWKTGLDYFRELVSRSFFQESSSHNSRFSMHDLLNDLAKLVAGPTHFSSRGFESESNENDASLARHASFISSYGIASGRLMVYHRMKRLRSFISLQPRPGKFAMLHLSQSVLGDLLSDLKYLKVLSLSHYCISEVPDRVGKLRHLHYLNLSYTEIERLPESIDGLFNLEALILRGCPYLAGLPQGVEKLINLRYLDIRETRSLQAMPKHIGNLVNLEILSKFIVGKENGLRLNELKNLELLRGELLISELHNVGDVGDAKEANLLRKRGIDRLTMKWSEHLEDSRNAELESKVLSFLQPQKDLRDLTISYYGGLKVPFWLGSPSHLNLVSLHLCRCPNIGSLPSLGRLSSLKELHIGGLNAVRMVGSEFYGTTEPFLSLTTLEFKDMSFWRDWTHFGFTEEIEVPFPCLQRLMVRNCPMLKGRLPRKLDSLVRLDIDSCPLLDASPAISLQSLLELYFRGCNEVTLKSLVNMTSLTALAVENVEGLACFPFGYTSSLTKLEKFEVRRCNTLIHLWQDRDYVQNLACLKILDVINCPQFVSFIAGEGDRELPSCLEAMKLSDCSSLEKLPNKMHNLASLRSLIVLNCPKLRSFPETGLPASVTSFTIENCEILQHLPMGTRIGNEMSRLRELRIYRCDSLPASPFSNGGLPATLKELKIHNCRGVKSLAEMVSDSGHQRHDQWLEDVRILYCEQLGSLPRSLQGFSHLTRLTIFGCPALELKRFPPLPFSISEFSLWSCPNIKSLPDNLPHLTSLQSLCIVDCENITEFPGGGLPPKIEILEARVCVNMKQHVGEWGLHTLASLQSLWIDGSVGSLGDMVCFPSDGAGSDHDILPSSLTYLNLSDMRNLERLSSGLPCSLQRLYTHGCRKLRYLPEAGLPSSLEHLSIGDCKVLEERCSKHAGDYWHLIKEIPTIYINNDLIS
ncbi:hypothetical protein BT93_L0291 [Corymbia citriodora subsp. variegata]|uniref:Disease resistance RPP13-like protein 1 n=1 Tax=Corymbia citriodora subsp. variegata TaxID=360336 RepID=A0A8T0CQ59_CORYI|nr:hypothetical protein BT93_L0291 [Corymbia citriodora subsp. variegata]